MHQYMHFETQKLKGAVGKQALAHCHTLGTCSASILVPLVLELPPPSTYLNRGSVPVYLLLCTVCSLYCAVVDTATQM